MYKYKPTVSSYNDRADLFTAWLDEQSDEVQDTVRLHLDRLAKIKGLGERGAKELLWQVYGYVGVQDE